MGQHRQEFVLAAVGFLQRLFVPLALGDITRRGEYSPQFSVAVVECARVVGNHNFLTVSGAGREFVVGDFAFAQHQFDARLGALRVGKVVLKRRTDQFVARACSERLHMLVHVGDDAARVGGHQRADVRFNQGTRVELLIAHGLINQHSLGFRLLPRRVVGADQQVADDSVLRVAQSRDGYHRREPAAVRADIGQLVNIFDPARGFEHQGLKAGRDRGSEFDAERFSAGDHFLRIGDLGRGDRVHHFGGGVA